MIVATFARDETQASVIGTVVTLLFAALGGNFVWPGNFPSWLQAFSRLTATRWGLEGFADLTMRGAGLDGVLLEASVLLGLAVVAFGLAAWRFRQVETG